MFHDNQSYPLTIGEAFEGYAKERIAAEGVRWERDCLPHMRVTRQTLLHSMGNFPARSLDRARCIAFLEALRHVVNGGGKTSHGAAQKSTTRGS